MGYYDGLVSVYFKNAQDGRMLYFPWLYLGRGYVIPSVSDYDRLQRQLRTYKSISLALITAAVIVLQHYVTALFVVSALAVGAYAVFTRHLVDGLERTDEKLYLRECLASEARTFGTSTLWLLEMGALAFVISGIVILVVDTSKWLPALGTILFFGLGAAQFAYLLVLRSRGTPPVS
jgi:hypothetical protein